MRRDGGTAPPSDDRRPPSKATLVFLRQTAGKSKAGRVQSFMVAPRSLIDARILLRHWNQAAHSRPKLPLVRSFCVVRGDDGMPGADEVIE
jgi:hypothetical protein